MALEKLRIIRETRGPARKGEPPRFDTGAAIVALFNPDELSFSGSIGWSTGQAAQRDVPEREFTGGDRTLSVKLLFDTYDTPDLRKNDVRTEYTSKVFELTQVEDAKHRPPVCQLWWGGAGKLFQGVIERLEQRFTLFMEDGTPVRATLTCSFKEWRTNKEDRARQGLQSADITKRKSLRRGDTLSVLAADEYGDPAVWRPIAEANDIDDPLRLPVGRALTVPRLPLNPKRPAR